MCVCVWLSSSGGRDRKVFWRRPADTRRVRFSLLRKTFLSKKSKSRDCFFLIFSFQLRLLRLDAQNDNE